MLFSITPLEKEWQLLATTDRITSNTAIFVRKNPIGSAATCFDYGVIVESKKSPTGPTEPTPKPEYLIAQGSVGKVPFSFWWIETSSNTSSNLNMLFSPNQLLPNWAKLRNIQAFKTKNMFHSPKKTSNQLFQSSNRHITKLTIQTAGTRNITLKKISCLCHHSPISIFQSRSLKISTSNGCKTVHQVPSDTDGFQINHQGLSSHIGIP